MSSSHRVAEPIRVDSEALLEYRLHEIGELVAALFRGPDTVERLMRVTALNALNASAETDELVSLAELATERKKTSFSMLLDPSEKVDAVERMTGLAALSRLATTDQITRFAEEVFASRAPPPED